MSSLLLLYLLIMEYLSELTAKHITFADIICVFLKWIYFQSRVNLSYITVVNIWFILKNTDKYFIRNIESINNNKYLILRTGRDIYTVSIMDLNVNLTNLFMSSIDVALFGVQCIYKEHAFSLDTHQDF